MLALDQDLSRELGPEPSQRVGETQPELTKTRLSRVRVGGQSNGHETAHLFIYSLLATSSVPPTSTSATGECRTLKKNSSVCVCVCVFCLYVCLCIMFMHWLWRPEEDASFPGSGVTD